MEKAAPLLSIAIPTYKRAELLRGSLKCLQNEIRGLEDEIEIVISDNASPDHTQQVVEEAQQRGPIRYSRNDENIGIVRNIARLPDELASGEFCWILGDDDRLQPGAVRQILDVIKQHKTLDYFFVNNGYKRLKKAADGTTIDPKDDLTPDYLLCSNPNSQIVPRWEDIIEFSQLPALFTFIGSHIFRLTMWKQASADLDLKGPEAFGTVEATFPHSVVIARQMIGKAAYYFGAPLVTLFTGAQEWFSLWPMLQVVRTLELSDLFERQGARQKMVDHYRNSVFNQSSEYFWRLLTVRKMPGRKYFSFFRLAFAYWRYPGFWKMAFQFPWKNYVRTLPKRILPSRMFSKLSRVKQSLRSKKKERVG